MSNTEKTTLRPPSDPATYGQGHWLDTEPPSHFPSPYTAPAMEPVRPASGPTFRQDSPPPPPYDAAPCPPSDPARQRFRHDPYSWWPRVTNHDVAESKRLSAGGATLVPYPQCNAFAPAPLPMFKWFVRVHNIWRQRDDHLIADLNAALAEVASLYSRRSGTKTRAWVVSVTRKRDSNTGRRISIARLALATADVSDEHKHHSQGIMREFEQNLRVAYGHNGLWLAADEAGCAAVDEVINGMRGSTDPVNERPHGLPTGCLRIQPHFRTWLPNNNNNSTF